ncbi:hypothetical protein ACFQL1_03975 [Halomicroarcula sp. GCM10025709]|uniref:hypothetical protein n=1 Tax=Haloarcula TaxID=2237 RepID=UPI0024C470BD|nr:hypothetical protein [Halomicroarcula sp. YJ-61-S]
MGSDERRSDETVADRWDRVLRQLSAEPRRQVLAALLEAPPDSRLAVPEGVVPAGSSIDPEALSVQLRHCHLPTLADAGYVVYDDAPFTVARGPNFDEVAAPLELARNGTAELPADLVDGYPILDPTATE